MNARFFAPAAGETGDLVTLPDEEAGHLTRVLRLAAGGLVRVFNGGGAEFDAVVESVGKEGVRLRVGARRTPAPEAAIAVTLAQAVLKGDKMDDVVRDAVMIGVAAIQPIVATRSEVSIETLARGRRRERWERIAVSSAKQCGRAVVPAIRDPQPFTRGGQPPSGTDLPSPRLMLVEPDARSGRPLADLDIPIPQQVTLLVGPEGGWTPEELEIASAFAMRITLGGRTLRADAIALVALAALFARWREF